jgi:uncharacterized membrane protein YgcG
MKIKRIVSHLFTTGWAVRRAFPRRSLSAIEAAIRRSEAAHAGQIRFAVEGALDTAALLRGQSARQRAIEVFGQLRVWDTEANNGVLIYLLLADRDVELVADRGIDAKVGAAEWERICRQMEAAFRQGDFESGIGGGIQAVTEHLAMHFSAQGGGPNELADQAVVL